MTGTKVSKFGNIINDERFEYLYMFFCSFHIFCSDSLVVNLIQSNIDEVVTYVVIRLTSHDKSFTNDYTVSVTMEDPCGVYVPPSVSQSFCSHCFVF